MKWSTVLSVIFILVISCSSSTAEIKVLNRYVIPSRTTRCFNDQVPCQTIEEYVSQPDMYFSNNTNFYFQPAAGNHRLNSSLILTSLRDVNFQGLPDNNVVNVLLGSFVSITWENCRFIQLTSISFMLPDIYIFSIVFKHTEPVYLYNISVIGNEYYDITGCSAILSQQSGIGIRDCKFIRIWGSFGAAIMMSESSVITTGINTFVHNVASAGGSIYLFNTTLTINGTNLFMNNHVNFYMDAIVFCTQYSITKDPDIRWYTGRGGAILCSNCTLIINEYSTFIRNSAEEGGVMAGLTGRISIYDSTSFYSNFANMGGAMYLVDIELDISGNVSLECNSATFGGALHIANTNISFNMNSKALAASETSLTAHALSSMVTFRHNTASQVGGAIESYINNILLFTGTIIFIGNSALNGGAIGFLQTSKVILIPILNISFIRNHANDSGGALYFKDFQCLIGSKSPLECFISVVNRSFYPNRKYLALSFQHNSAGSIGSTLYGEHLSECRLYYRTKLSYNFDPICDNKLSNEYDYTDDALQVFMNISRIINHKESDINISSPVKKIKLCEDHPRELHAYLGEQFNVTLKAINQGGSPVPANILIDNSYTLDDKYGISPLSQSINASCTNVYFRLYSSERDRIVRLGLFPENPCQSLIKALEIIIHIKHCPNGFEIPKNYDRCVCNRKIKKIYSKLLHR